jgi:hypothetical protein
MWLNVPSFSGDRVCGGAVNLFVQVGEALHAELVAKGVRIDMGAVDQTWSSRGTSVKDIDGNCIRFIQKRVLRCEKRA